MWKHLLSGGVLLAALLAVTPARATINPEPFLTSAGYAASTPLSAFFWTAADDTTAVLDLEDIGGGHGLVTKLTADGPDPGPGFLLVTAGVPNSQVTGWGGPGRDNNGPLWWSMDIERGTPDATTPLDSFIWSITFTPAQTGPTC